MSTQEEPNDKVYGQLMHGNGQRRLYGLRVHAFDRRMQQGAMLGEATTDEGGAYCIVWPASLYRQESSERGGPDLIVRDFDADGALLAQSELMPNSGPHTEVNLRIDGSLQTTRGTVRDDASRAPPGLLVRVGDRDLRHEQPLGEVVTDTEGQSVYKGKLGHRISDHGVGSWKL